MPILDSLYNTLTRKVQAANKDTTREIVEDWVGNAGPVDRQIAFMTGALTALYSGSYTPDKWLRIVECAVRERVVALGDVRRVAMALADIVEAHEAAMAAGIVQAGFDADTRFHRALVDASGLPGLWDVVARAREMHHRIRAIAVPELGSTRTAIAEHRAIVRALKAGRVEAARAAMSRHIGRNLLLAREIALRHPDYFEGAATPDSADGQGLLAGAAARALP